MIKRLIFILLLGWLPATALGEVNTKGELIGKNEKEIRAVAEPLLDTQLAGINTGNYDLYIKNYDPPLQLLFTKEKFDQVKDQVSNRLGKYKSRDYLGYLIKGKDTQILWKGKFDKTDDDVLIRLVVSRKEGKNLVMGVYFQ